MKTPNYFQSEAANKNGFGFSLINDERASVRLFAIFVCHHQTGVLTDSQFRFKHVYPRQQTIDGVLILKRSAGESRHAKCINAIVCKQTGFTEERDKMVKSSYYVSVD